MNKNRTNNFLQAINDWFDIHSDRLIEDLGQLIAVESVRGTPEPNAPYGAGPRRVLALAKEIIERRGIEVCDFEDIMITADLPGAGAPVLGILAHLDIVPAGEGWDTDPLELTKRGGYLYGRGTSDDKGPAVAAMYAMFAARELAPESFTRGFRLILGSGEETGCHDIERYLSCVTPPPHVFTPDAGYPVYNTEKGRYLQSFKAEWPEDTAQRRIVSVTGGNASNIVPNRAKAVISGFSQEDTAGYCEEFSKKTGTVITARQDGDAVMVTAEGSASHAASPELGVNALTALISMLAKMPFPENPGFRALCGLARLFPHGDTRGEALGIAMSDDETGALTVNFGVLSLCETGLSGNFDSRTPACADKHPISKLAADALTREGIKPDVLEQSKCHHTSPDSELVKTLLRVYEEYTGKKGECRPMGGTTYVHEIPGGVAFGCGMDGFDDRIHGANERIGTEQLLLSAKMFTQVILDMCL